MEEASRPAVVRLKRKQATLHRACLFRPGLLGYDATGSAVSIRGTILPLDTSVADLREAERRCSDHAINQIFYNGPIDQAFSSLVANAATLTNKSGFTADTSYSRRWEPRGTIGARCRKSDRRRVFCARISTCWIFASGHAASTRLLPLCVRLQQNAGFEPNTRSWWRKMPLEDRRSDYFACRKFYSGALDRMKLRTER